MQNREPKNQMRPIHPGEVLKEDFLEPVGLSPEQLAHAIRVDLRYIRGILTEKRPMTAHIALRLARYFGGDAMSWMNVQSRFDLRIAEFAAGAGEIELITPHTQTRKRRRATTQTS